MRRLVDGVETEGAIAISDSIGLIPLDAIGVDRRRSPWALGF